MIAATVPWACLVLALRSVGGRIGRLLGVGLWIVATGEACAASSQPEGSIAHGPFEIAVRARRISKGTFPNQGGNPFGRREVADFQVRWRGQKVSTPGGNQNFWRVLRLSGAPRPALLLVTTGFVLVQEDAGGKLAVTPIKTRSSSLAELQWLDARSGQPGESMTFGIERLADLQAATGLSGGQWLRLGSEAVMDVSTLTVYSVAPWVPVAPGEPMTEPDRAGDEVRAFSPGRTKYVLLASGYDYKAANRPTIYGLLVVDIRSGVASSLRMDRRRFRFGAQDEVTSTWIEHHFEWVRDGGGVERLVPRAQFSPWPWRCYLWESRPGVWELKVRRVDPAFLAVMRRVILTEPGVREVKEGERPGGGWTFELGGCEFSAAAYDGADADGHYATIAPRGEKSDGTCLEAIRRVAAAIDAELATGRHDGLLKWD